MKIYLKIFILFLLILTIVYFNFTISKNCKSLKIFRSGIDLGFDHIKECYSKESLTTSIKEILKNFPLAYEIGRKFRRTYITYDFILDNPPNKKQIEYADTKKKLDKNLKIPFIKGIINNKTEITKNTTIINNNAEHDSWLRSHGGYWNTKYHSGKQINLDNINKLKLVWKYTSIKKKDLDKKYIQNIQLNPVFVDNKLIAATADWKIIALDAQTGKLLWQLQSLHAPGRRGMLIDLDKASGNKFLYIPA